MIIHDDHRPTAHLQATLLHAAGGNAFNADLISSPMQLDVQYAFKGAVARVDKPSRFVICMKDNRPLAVTYSDPKLKVARTLKK